MITIKPVYEDIIFVASNKKQSASVELSISYETGKFTLSTTHEESVSFKGDTLVVAKLKLTAIKAALKHVESKLNKKHGNQPTKR